MPRVPPRARRWFYVAVWSCLAFLAAVGSILNWVANCFTDSDFHDCMEDGVFVEKCSAFCEASEWLAGLACWALPLSFIGGLVATIQVVRQRPATRNPPEAF